MRGNAFKDFLAVNYTSVLTSALHFRLSGLCHVSIFLPSNIV